MIKRYSRVVLILLISIVLQSMADRVAFGYSLEKCIEELRGNVTREESYEFGAVK